MKFKWTSEQEALFTAATDPSIDFLQVSAVAGASKTTSLVEVANRLPSSKILYMTFSKAMADEAQGKFPSNVECRTLHSLAYRNVVKQYGLDVGWFNVRDIQSEGLTYSDKKEVHSTIELFLSSAYTDPVVFLNTQDMDELLCNSVIAYLDLMADAVIPCNHSFYLKMYHVLLANGTITADKYDVLMIDEAGDLTPLTIEMFKLLPIKKKIMVGDPMQSIFTFMNCTNAFEYFKGQGTATNLTQSFRVAAPIAKRIEGFMHKHVDTNFKFKGRVYPKDCKPRTKGYIARTNSGLVSEMLRLQEENIAFHTTRKIEQILELPLILANLKTGKAITNTKYKAIEALRSNWEAQSKRGNQSFLSEFKSPLSYVRRTLSDDNEITSAMQAIDRYGPSGLNSLAKYVRDCVAVDTGLTLTTAHSSKGLEFDEVEISPDFNEALDKAKEKLKVATDPKVIESLNTEFLLYYVGCSRALVKLDNARHLPAVDSAFI